ncbi:DUF4124 domain-containing protein [Shewanella woodyi]|uniref:DUF4124 domain-containing protein n=1 Tax=Shewanella woodyi TaxID=60961 RepID=UPI003749CB4F
MTAMFIAAGTQAQTLYKWVDENGTVHYSDRPTEAKAEIVGEFTVEKSKEKAREVVTKDAEDENDRFKLKLEPRGLRRYSCDGEYLGQKASFEFAANLSSMRGHYERGLQEKQVEISGLKRQLEQAFSMEDMDKSRKVSRIIDSLEYQISLGKCHIEYYQVQLNTIKMSEK